MGRQITERCEEKNWSAWEWRVLGLLGYLFPAELGGLLEGLEGLRPGKRQPWTPIRSHCCGWGVPLSHCCRLVVAFACGRGACGGALQPLLWPCSGFCVREWRVLGLLGYLFPAELGGPLEGLERLRPGKRQPWTPIRGPYSHGCGRGVPFSYCCGLVVAFACGSGACWACWGTFSVRSWADFWRVWGLANGSLERLYKKLLLRPGGALEPLLWPGGHCCGLVVAFVCGSGACWACWGTFSVRSCADLNAYIRSHCCGRGVPLSHCCGRGVPFSHCCGLVVAFACGSGACWACWGTFSLRSWADFWRVWRVWGLANGSLERL